jgi:hypothetical protein
VIVALFFGNDAMWCLKLNRLNKLSAISWRACGIYHSVRVVINRLLEKYTSIERCFLFGCDLSCGVPYKNAVLVFMGDV